MRNPYHHDDRQRIASYGSDFERSTMDLDRSIVYAKAAQDCYQREFDNLRAAHRNKSMSDSEGRSRFAEIVNTATLSGRVWLDADNDGTIGGLLSAHHEHCVSSAMRRTASHPASGLCPA